MYAVGATETNLMYSSGYRDYMTADLTQSQPLISSSSGGGGGGLARYRSAPSSFFSTLLDGGGGGFGVPYDLQFPAAAVKEEAAAEQQQRREYSVFGEEGSNNQVRQVQGSNNQVQQAQGKIGGLARQSSSPAGFFSNLAAVDNGFSVMSDVGNFRAANVINEKSAPSRRLNDHINFSSGKSSSLSYMPQIAESGNESTNPENEQLGNGNNSNNFYIPSFENNSWEESNLSGLKRCRENEDKFSGFTTMDSRRGDDTNYPANRLTHHMSLPKTSGEMAAIEKYLQFQQDAVPCKIRAKRGFATHPRSIAERVRRTRISDRMKKLQDLFPNMDKQTNTAEMLDLAVEYIKDLQSQVQTLTGKKAKCTCSK